MATIHEILRPLTLTKVISQIAATTNRLLMFFEMGPGGANETYVGHGRQGSYRVFDNVRSATLGRAPGTPAGRRSRRPVKEIPFVYPRSHEEVYLLAEEIHNISKISDPRMRDEAGADFIRQQTRPVGQRNGNWRTQQIVGMMRDSLYVVEDGDDWYFSTSSSGSLYRINYQMPSGNKDQLDMLGDGSIIDTPWSNPNANIPRHCQEINAAFLELNGGRLTDVFVNHVQWDNVVNNDYVAAGHGIANPPFKTFEREVGTGPDGIPINEQVGTLLNVPGVTWHITDEGLEWGAPGSETYDKHIGNNNAWFGVGPREFPDVYQMYQGSEPIVEYDNGPETVKIGAQSWSKKSSNPTGTEIFQLDNALAVNHVPNGSAYGTVDNF